MLGDTFTAQCLLPPLRSSSQPLLELRDAGFRYGTGEPWVLRHLDLSIQPGERLCIKGRSGTGKSTLLRIMAGMLALSEGSLVRSKQPLTDCALFSGFMFQDARLLPWRTALGNILLGMHVSSLPRAARRDYCLSLLEAVGLAQFAHRLPRELSGGQKQRIALARALATGAPLLLLDEPFSALDGETRREMHAITNALTEQRGISLVLVSHHPEDAAAYSAKTLLLKE